ncbi:AAA family ATPase [Imhoffiella purpurea]|uniref:General secretion pathway protein A n=1 Tax=Imhoffiella purpurea TaxID=1249627 RepID=W9V7F7_9GAMM|nr:AAA family ATPase [Imhoffiella purpurea]EXJ15334.1 General secretion pathway protein A [Imhoffiella purpurea]
MYESFFGLNEKPFSLLPDPSFFYLSKIHREALTLVEYGLYSQSGFTVLTGEVGSGKTTLMRYLLHRLEDDLTIGLISNTHESLGQIMDWVCAAFELNVPPGSKLEQHQAFVDFLLSQYAKGKKTLLIIDEAQNLGLERLEEIRLLSNINADKDLVLQLLLLGQPQLRQQLRRPELEQFVQRVSASYHLGRLTSEETYRYIRHRLETAGGSKEIFTADACHAAFHYSKGIPRIINLICETALVFSYGAGEHLVTGQAIDNLIKSDASNLLFAVDAEDRVPLTEEAIQEFIRSVGVIAAETAGPQDQKANEPDPTADQEPEGERQAPAPRIDRHRDPSAADSPRIEPPRSEEPQPPRRPDASGFADINAKPERSFHSVANRADEAAIPPMDLTQESASTRDELIRYGHLPKRKRTKELVAITAGLCLGFALVLWSALRGYQEPPPQHLDSSAIESEGPGDTTKPPSPPVQREEPARPDPAQAPLAENPSRNRSEQPEAIRVTTNEEPSRPPAPQLPAERSTEAASSIQETTEAAASRPLSDVRTAVAEPEPEPEPEPHQDGMSEIAEAISAMGLNVETLAPDRIRSNFADRIQFGSGSAELDERAKSLLRDFAALAKDRNDLEVLVTAHTDSLGSRTINQSLSELRAAKVADVLIAAGLDPDRVRHAGKGEDQLLVDPGQERTRGPWVNRRIEIDLIEKAPDPRPIAPESDREGSLLPDQLPGKDIGQI